MIFKCYDCDSVYEIVRYINDEGETLDLCEQCEYTRQLESSDSNKEEE